MKKRILQVAFLFSFIYTQASGTEPSCQFRLDITRLTDGKLPVELTPPATDGDEIVYHIPKIVPGTYEIYDFGRFISGFKATDKEGKELSVEHMDLNSWKIKNARQLARINYLVENSWHSKAGLPLVFEPAGTNLEEGKNFILNNHGFFGYFEGLKKIPYELTIIRPPAFYPSTSLTGIETHGQTDVFRISDYMKLVDSPIMYCVPDTSIIHIGDAQILISSYSPNHLVSAAFIAGTIAEVIQAQKEYLGGKLPIEKYAFIFYFNDKPTQTGNNGALEHNLSSFYVLPEAKGEYLKRTLRNVAAHEFFHIVTPLSIHSEEIADFDFMKPKMSEHLWLYEGLTEYSAGLVQIKYGLIDLNAYLDLVHEKIVNASRFNDTMSFTRMSSHVVEPGYHDQYNNVYEKGALIGMCLDIKLRKLSGGKYGIQDMLRDLSKTYGREKAFKDEELFGEITKLTYPEIGAFFQHYVIGGNPFPYKELLGYAGINYAASQRTKGITLGSLELGYDTLMNHFTIAGTSHLDKFGKLMKYKAGDEILTFNDTGLNLQNAQEVIMQYISNAKPGDELRMEVLRPGKKGVFRNKKLHAKLIEIESEETHVLSPVPEEELTPSQLDFRKAWINK
ncbi:MAG: peptidase M61 [Bacteroidia bacterium]